MVDLKGKKNCLTLYHPLFSLKNIDNNIWIADGPEIQMSVGFLKIPFSTRMTLIRLKDNTIWCHSPIKVEESLQTEVESLGPVRYLVSPNKLHYSYISQWKDAYPQASSWASPGVREKMSKKGIMCSFDYLLEEKSPKEWSEEIEQHIFQGSRMVDEVVFFHKESKTLILTDLIENFEVNESFNCFWKLIYRIGGMEAPKGKTPLDYRASFIGNHKEARNSIEKILDWNPEKIILSHGTCFLQDGKRELERAFSWLL